MSGLVMESKSEILAQLDQSSEHMPTWTVLDSDLSQDQRLEVVDDFMRRHGLNWPIVIKPDVGQRGEGVAIIRERSQIVDYIARNPEKCILQEYLRGSEFGVFFFRFPKDATARIFSITEKQMPSVIGDGRRTLRQLITSEPRLLAMAPHYIRVNSTRAEKIIAEGEKIQLVDLGSHCRGAIFLDGNNYQSEQLAEALDQLVPAASGICFGRFDLRVSDPEHLKKGHSFKVIELNGVSSESTDIYDPKNSVFTAFRKLCQQWRLAFQIGVAHRAAGAHPPSIREIFALLRRHLKRKREALPEMQREGQSVDLNRRKRRERRQ